MQGQRAEVVDRIDAAAGNQLAVVRKDRHLDVILKIAHVGVRGGQGIAGGWVEHGRPGWRTLAASLEHEGILSPPRTQRRDAEGVDAALAQLFVALQVRVEDAPASNDANADHLYTLLHSHRIALRGRDAHDIELAVAQGLHPLRLFLSATTGRAFRYLRACL